MLEEIRRIIIEELNLDDIEITEKTIFKDDLGADSLDLFELIMTLEEKYNIEIPAEKLEELTTVGALMDYLTAQGVKAIGE
ncbi:MAG: acyl carrier protein [Lachnospiraceae bacterium]